MQNDRLKVKIIIIGAGLTGLSAARSVRDTINSVPIIFEKNKTAGGLCRTEESDGFLFDYTGHFLHFNNKEIKDEILKSFKGNTLLKIKRKSFIYFKKKFIPYPFQSNVYHLPEKVRSDCLVGFLNSLKARDTINGGRDTINGVPNFHNWMVDQFGDGIVRHFMLPYNNKMWRVHPRELTTEWMSRFVPRPQAEEIIAGAVGPQKEVKGYNATFYYPAAGIKELVKKIAGNKIKILYDNRVDKVNWREKTVCAGGKKEHYDFLIVTCPLKEFVLKMLASVDPHLLNYAGRLKYTSVLNINIGWRGDPAKEVPPKTHWLYFPESKFSFYRVGFLPAVSSKMVPKGCWSCYVEVSYPGGNLPPKEKYGEIESKIIKQLKGAGIIPGAAKIVKTLTFPIEVAYVVYDKNWKTSRNFILNYLKEKNIFCGGRYGGWEYSTMEDALIEGRRLMKLCHSK